MNKTLKILLGLVTLWPALYMVIFFAFVFSAFLFVSSSEGGDPGFPLSFMIIFPLHLLTMIVIVALTIFYIMNVFKNTRVEKDKKVLWAIVLFMGNLVAMPIYWYLYIWKDSEAPPAQLGSADSSAWVNTATESREQPEYVPPPKPPDWRQ